MCGRRYVPQQHDGGSLFQDQGRPRSRYLCSHAAPRETKRALLHMACVEGRIGGDDTRGRVKLLFMWTARRRTPTGSCPQTSSPSFVSRPRPEAELVVFAGGCVRHARGSVGLGGRLCREVGVDWLPARLGHAHCVLASRFGLEAGGLGGGGRLHSFGSGPGPPRRVREHVGVVRGQGRGIPRPRKPRHDVHQGLGPDSSMARRPHLVPCGRQAHTHTQTIIRELGLRDESKGVDVQWDRKIPQEDETEELDEGGCR